MKFTIEIQCDNAVFEDNMRGEVARILKEAILKLEYDFKEVFPLHDNNGNRVGFASFDETAP